MAMRPEVMYLFLGIDTVCQVWVLPCEWNLQYCYKSSVLTVSGWYTVKCKCSVQKLVSLQFVVPLCPEVAKLCLSQEPLPVGSEVGVCYGEHAGLSAWAKSFRPSHHPFIIICSHYWASKPLLTPAPAADRMFRYFSGYHLPVLVLE